MFEIDKGTDIYPDDTRCAAPPQFVGWRALAGSADGPPQNAGCQPPRVIRGTVMRSIGYRSVPLPDVPFDDDRGVIPNRSGRLVDGEGAVCAGEYVSGWARRGPTGVIGTNKGDAREVVAHLLEDWPDLQPARSPDPADLDALLEAKGVRRVDADDWERLRRMEHRRGSRHHRRAIKFVEVDEMLRLLDEEGADRPAAAAE